jgi:DNA-binding MarR family transcriptional regulator
VSPTTDGGFLITKIHHLSKRVFGKLLRDQGFEINPGQGLILYALWKNDGVSIKELGKRTSLMKSTLTEMLDRMEVSGYLTRRMSESDRRQMIVKLTAKTNRLNKQYSKVSEEMGDIFYKGFEDHEINEFEKYLSRVLENLIHAESQR